MIHTDGRRTVANAPAAHHNPIHAGRPGLGRLPEHVREDGRCGNTGVRFPECSCLPCLEHHYRTGTA